MPYTDPHSYDLKAMAQLAAQGLTIQQIAEYYGIPSSTFYRHMESNPNIRIALNAGKARANSAVANVLYQRAISGDLGAIVWYEKTRTGRSDRIELTVQNGIQLEIDHMLNVLQQGLTPNEYHKVLELLSNDGILENDKYNVNQRYSEKEIKYLTAASTE